MLLPAVYSAAAGSRFRVRALCALWGRVAGATPGCRSCDCQGGVCALELAVAGARHCCRVLAGASSGCRCRVLRVCCGAGLPVPLQGATSPWCWCYSTLELACRCRCRVPLQGPAAGCWVLVSCFLELACWRAVPATGRRCKMLLQVAVGGACALWRWPANAAAGSGCRVPLQGVGVGCR